MQHVDEKFSVNDLDRFAWGIQDFQVDDCAKNIREFFLILFQDQSPTGIEHSKVKPWVEFFFRQMGEFSRSMKEFI